MARKDAEKSSEYQRGFRNGFRFAEEYHSLAGRLSFPINHISLHYLEGKRWAANQIGAFRRTIDRTIKRVSEMREVHPELISSEDIEWCYATYGLRIKELDKLNEVRKRKELQLKSEK